MSFFGILSLVSTETQKKNINRMTFDGFLQRIRVLAPVKGNEVCVSHQTADAILWHFQLGRCCRQLCRLFECPSHVWLTGNSHSRLACLYHADSRGWLQGHCTWVVITVRWGHSWASEGLLLHYLVYVRSQTNWSSDDSSCARTLMPRS